ncbi:MAG: acyl-CoA dehydrogenase protein [Hyphomicrobiales bacterium]|nr:acyl-CoA dehydrogenase protein [Hyphomicrobiales bacterium]
MNHAAFGLMARADEVAAVARLHADAVDKEGRFPVEAIEALKRTQLLGAMIPTDCGGGGASLETIAEICAILGQACGSTAMIYAMHQIKASSLVSHGLESPWHRDFMRRCASEQLLLASATTEGGVGGDLRNSICAVVRDGDVFDLDKDATVISYALYADAILVTSRRAPEAQSSDQVMSVVTREQISLDRTTGWDTLGMRGTCSEGFRLTARAPVAQILPKPFAEIAAQSMLATSHLLWGSLWYGIAAAALTRAQAYVRAEARRKPNVTPTGATRLVQGSALLDSLKSALADGLARYEAAAATQDGLSSVSFAIAMNNVKINASETANAVIQHALMICGIMGYKNDTPFSVGRHLRDALSAPLMISNDRIIANNANLMLAHRLGKRIVS